MITRDFNWEWLVTFCLSAFNKYSLCAELKETNVMLLSKVNSDVNVESKLRKVEHCHESCTGWKGRLQDVFESDSSEHLCCRQSLYLKNATGPES